MVHPQKHILRIYKYIHPQDPHKPKCSVSLIMQLRLSTLSNDESKLTLGYHASSNQPHHTTPHLVQGAPWSAAITAPRPTLNTTLL